MGQRTKSQLPRQPLEQHRTSRLTTAVCMLSLSALSSAQFQATFAATFPGTGAPLAMLRQVQPDKGADPTNPYSYQLCRQVAKCIIQNGLPIGVILNREGQDSKNSMDLTTILLFEAGLLKSPVHFMHTGKKKVEIPTLSAGAIPDSTGDMPSAAPKISTDNALDSDDGTISIKVRERAKEHGESPALNLDYKSFSSDLPDTQLKKTTKKKKAEEIASLAMVQPMSMDEQHPSNPQEYSFKFWTVPPVVTAPPEISLINKTPPASFVMMSPVGLRAIDGRTFFLTQGHILLSNGGKPLIVDTPLARINVEAGATVFIESKSSSTRVRVIESKDASPGVTIKYNSDNKACENQLSNGDDFLVTGQSLSDADKAIQKKSSTGTASGGTNWSKTVFSTKELIESDSFFSIDSQNQNPEQRSAMIALRNRIK